MAHQLEDGSIISAEHMEKWKSQKREEYKTDEYNPQNENDWRNIPLFSDTLDPRNPQAAAILKMQQKEKPKNKANNFKKSGNRAYLLGPDRYQDAIGYYTQALDVNCKDKTLNATIYANRAQVHLRLKNYGKVIDDCTAAIALDGDTHKAYWRAAMAARALSKYPEAIQWCEEGLAVMQRLIEKEQRSPTKDDSETKSSSDSESSSDEQSSKRPKKSKKSELETLKDQLVRFKGLKEKVVAQQMEIERKERVKREKEMAMKQRLQQQRDVVRQRLEERNIVIGTEDRYNIYESYGKHYAVEYDAKEKELVFPVLFFYPEHNQSDFVKAFAEGQRFSDHLSTMFAPKAPAPSWDVKNRYLSHRLCVFYETKHRFIHINAQKTLRDIVQREDYVIPILPVFFVLSRDSEFTSVFMRKKSEALLN